MRLNINFKDFRSVFLPLKRYRRVGVVDAGGNAGDRIINAAVRQLLDLYRIDWITVNPGYDPLDRFGVKALVVFGGGNMGTKYHWGRRLRWECIRTGLPCFQMPQSWETPESLPYEQQWARDALSQEIAPEGTGLAPDLALAYDFKPRSYSPAYGTGLFLRHDNESMKWPSYEDAPDPIYHAHSPREYIDLAAKYSHIITDRLHFSIAGLMAGRRVTLLPNSYHKNLGMYESWLRHLGCQWAETPEEALRESG